MFDIRSYHPEKANDVATFGFRFEIYDTAFWLTVWFWRRKWMWRKLREATRETGPEDNRSVLWHFFNGQERRRKNVDFKSGFAEAAKKGPVKLAGPTSVVRSIGGNVTK